MSKKGGVLTTGLLLVACMLAPIASAHEQKTLTVIMSEQGVVSGNITDPAFVQGNAIWFQMHDDTENTTMTVRLDTNLNGVFDAGEDFESVPLVHECEMDENGSLVDEDCAVSTTFAFDLNATVATYLFWVHHDNNGTESIWNHSVTVHKDVHEEEGPTPGDCFGIGCALEEAPKKTKPWRTRSMRTPSSSCCFCCRSSVGLRLRCQFTKNVPCSKPRRPTCNEE